MFVLDTHVSSGVLITLWDSLWRPELLEYA